MRRAVFAIPGDLATLTGGYLYERRLLEGLREVGTDVRHLALGASFPDPSPGDHAEAVDALAAVDAKTPLILDGFIFGSMEPAALARMGSPIVGVVHHPLAHEQGLSAARRAHLFDNERANLRLAAAVLVPSPHTARTLVDEYGADPDLITIARPGTDRPSGGRSPVEPPLILSVGIQHPRKGHDVLLQALAGITHLSWNATIVGSAYDPAHAAELMRRRAELGLADRVRFTGSVSLHERNALYRRASVFALATRYEGYGLVFDEALAYGLPIVSCRTGAVPETVPRAAGLLVPTENPGAFGDALGMLLQDDDLRTRMSQAAERAGSSLPSWRDTATAVQAVLDALA